jgi:archaellum component FlaG (FlaF/FlaG flagellin family)
VQVTISTAILLIATIIAASVFTGAALSELYTFQDTFKQVGSKNQAIFESSITIIGETQASSPNRIIIWVKNIGTTSFPVGTQYTNPDQQYWDVFITFPNQTFHRFAYNATSQYNCFTASILNDQGSIGLWNTGKTVQITIYTNVILLGQYQVSISLSNGVTAQDPFSF